MTTEKSKTKASSKKATPPKKTTFSDREYVAQLPAEDDIAMKDDDARFLPIDVIERDLDRWVWTTQNFTWQQYKDKFGNICVAASLELVLPWTKENGTVVERKLVGGCNFIIATYAPNSHFVATAKSECVKNAASDLGKKFGRGLNEGFAEIPVADPVPSKAITKMKPDKGILAQFKKAQEEGDQTVINILSSVYELNPQENGN